MSNLTVVTGAAGHVGANLVRALLEKGRRVRCIVRDDTRALDGLDVERVRGDVLEPESLRRAFAGADVVHHLAARISILGGERGRVWETNVAGVRRVVEACLACGVRRLVHFSSVHAFDQRPLDEPVDEARGPADDRRNPVYDRSKAAGVREVLAGVERGLDAVILHPSGVIGPWDYKPSRIGRFLLGLLRGRVPAAVAGGFDWVDARDVAAGALAAEERGRTGERYILSGHYATVGELVEFWGKISGARMPGWTSPMWLARLGAPFVGMYAKIFGAEPLFTTEALHALRGNRAYVRDKAERELGYSPRPLEETLTDTYAWFVGAGITEEKPA
ncbi:MAG TPA: SDR family oxidoreductase [bacterium]|nr:SDR family oxidoreductase [bacterium]